MRRGPQLLTICLMLILATGRGLPASGQFADLLTKVPAGANTIVVLDPEQIFASPVAAAGGWKQRYDQTFADSPLMMPPSARQFVLAADLDLEHFHPRWQAAVMRLSADPSMAMVARTIRGQQDSLAGKDTVVSPKGGRLVKFGPNVFGAIQPGDRQGAGRWIESAARSTASPLSPYLKSAAEVPDRVGTEIIMAIDLANALSPDRVRLAMSRSDVIKGKSIDPQAAAVAISSIRGLTLGVRVVQRVYGVLKIDFAGDPAVIAPVAKPLLIEILGEAGASIDEFANWNVKVEGQRISLDGELTDSGLRRLFSFLELDSTGVDAADPAAANANYSQADATAQASLKYYQAVVRYLNDLKNERGASSYYTIALWFDKYSKRIDRLPILGVDKDMVDFGKRTASQMRNCVEAIRGAGITSGAQSAQVVGGGNYSYYPLFGSPANYAHADIAVAEEQRRAIRAQAQAQSSTDVRAVIFQIEEDRSNVRRQMTERYQIEFTDFPQRQPQTGGRGNN